MRFSPDEFADLVREALEDIPEPLAAYMRDLAVEVEPMPDERTCERLGLDDPRSLLGLYHGVPLTGRSIQDSGRLPDRITIYQHNIERLCRTRRQVIRQVRTTVFHEVGHHFGLDEDDLAELGFR
jgi:predicted Zn-dependent protease with MMP-like domain